MKDIELSPEDVEKNKKAKPLIGYYKFWVMLTYLSVVSAIVGMSFASGGDLVLAMI